MRRVGARTAASVYRSRLWSRVQRRARAVLEDPEALQRLVRRGEEWSDELTGRRARMTEDFKALLRLTRAHARGEYEDVSWETMVLVVAAILYLLSPADLIPDWIPGAGFLDDITVANFALHLVRGEIDRFREWESRREQEGGCASG